MSSLNQPNHLPRVAMLVAALALWAGTAKASPITPFNTEGAFTAAVSGSTVETFDNQIAGVSNGDRTTFDYGPFLIHKDSPIPGDGQGSQAGNWRSRPSVAKPDIIVFDDMMIAWGGFIDTQSGGDGVGIDVTVELQLLNNDVLVGTVGAGSTANIGFLGFLSTVAFNSIRLTSVAPGADTYTLDNMRYKAASQAVPAPSSLALIGVGLLGMAGVMRRRNTLS